MRLNVNLFFFLKLSCEIFLYLIYLQVGSPIFGIIWYCHYQYTLSTFHLFIYSSNKHQCVCVQIVVAISSVADNSFKFGPCVLSIWTLSKFNISKSSILWHNSIGHYTNPLRSKVGGGEKHHQNYTVNLYIPDTQCKPERVVPHL